MFLVTLPYELVSYVIQELDLADIYSLSLSCKKFQFLFREPSITKLLLETKAPHSAEAREASRSKEYAVQLRRLMKRREAVASVSPCLVAVVARAEDWLYAGGVLCHIRHHQLRILDLHHSGALELVVDLKALLHEVSNDGRKPRAHKVRLLHYSHNLVSCLVYRPNRRSPFLLAFNHVRGKVIIWRQLESTNKLFVRNNHEFLYYGFTTGPHEDDDEQWVLRAFEINKNGKYLGVFSIPEIIGTDLGSTVCFDIFDGHFYGLSNQASMEVEMGDWVSCYLCFRFPLSEDGFNDIEVLPREKLWRRNQTEGPLDDRWGFMRMFKDEATGQLKVVESRREWLAGAISAKLTYYTTPISFGTHPDKKLAGRHNLEGADAYMAVVKTQHQRVIPPATTRDPHAVHPGDDHSGLAITLSKCHVRSYHPSCQAFVDLVDDSQSFDPRDQRLRLCGGARRLRPADGIVQQTRTSVAQGLLPEHAEGQKLLCQIDNLYKSEAGIFWPREPLPQDPSAAAAQNNDPALTELYAVLNPPGHVGRPQGSCWDERSMIYATGPSAEGLHALVFVSWDPAIYLTGTPRHPSVLSSAGPGNSNGRDMVTSRRCPTLQPDATSFSGGSLGSRLPLSGVDEECPAAWKSWESTQYREIRRGYHFMS